jgi:uncharacterized protein (DUF433 family)
MTDRIEEHFDFLSPEDIRVKGTRVGVEHILYEYIYYAKSPEEIAKQFQTVSLEQVYATILYYLENKEVVGKYVGDWLAYCLKAEAEFDRNPPYVIAKLRQWKEEQKALNKPELAEA